MTSKKSHIEVDICAKLGDKIDIFEVKCSYRKTKAKKQLKRARKHIEAEGNSFFYCGSSGMLEQVVI